MKFLKHIFHIVISLSIISTCLGQGITVQNDHRTQRLIEWLDVSNKVNDVFSSIRFRNSKSLVDSLIFLKQNLTGVEHTDALYALNQYNYFVKRTPIQSNFEHRDGFHEYTLQTDSTWIFRKPILKYFHTSPHHFYTFNSDQFTVMVDPLIDFHYGYQNRGDNTLFHNQRGLRISGYIDNKVYFFSEILETQSAFPSFVQAYINNNNAIPGNALYKEYDSSILNLSGKDYLNASGYVGFNISKSVSLDLGHGRNFIGNGQRSLLLSDFSTNYFYLKLNTKIWKFHYQNIFAELAAVSEADQTGDVLLPKKYMATHYLAYKPWKNVELGLFESVIFSRENHFEFQYLNPVILYRSIEQSIGSPDNALLGMNASVNIFRTAKVYGQVVIDEFKLNELSNNWWGNKFGWQIGSKYYNAFNVKGLDIGAEYNWVRPYTYAQSRPIEGYPERSITSYSHHNQALAHPLGANFKEQLISIDWNPLKSLYLQLRYVRFEKGEDIDNGISYGGNILLNTALKSSTYDVDILQGQNVSTNFLQLSGKYYLWPNIAIYGECYYRNQSSTSTKNSYGVLLGMSYNIQHQSPIF